MADITAIILTGNEEKNIIECISSIKGIVKRIVVVDSGSTDNTVALAKDAGAEVLVNELRPFLYAKQFLYGMENAGITTKWVLRIDADERLTAESAARLIVKTTSLALTGSPLWNFTSFRMLKVQVRPSALAE